MYQMKLITLLVQELFHEALFLAVDFIKISGICWFGLLVYFFLFFFEFLSFGCLNHILSLGVNIRTNVLYS